MEKEINKKVISKIEEERIKMKSKLYFILESLLVIGVIFLLFLFILYLGSLVVFVFRSNNILHFHGMGFSAFRSIIFSFPWYLISLSFGLIILVGVVGKRFQFIYQKPLFYSLVGIILVTLFGSFLIEKSSIHQHFFSLARREKLPVMGKMYRNLGNLDIENAYFGKVLEKGDQLTVKLEDGQVVSLKITEKTISRRLYFELEEGDDLLIIGQIENGLMDVFAFRKINHRLRLNER